MNLKIISFPKAQAVRSVRVFEYGAMHLSIGVPEATFHDLKRAADLSGEAIEDVLIREVRRIGDDFFGGGLRARRTPSR